MLQVLAHRPFLSSRHFFPFFFALFNFIQVVAGQTLINGQTFTNGLSIIDSPTPLNPGHAGSPISIAVDVSGDGHLQSTTTSSIDLLDIYLVSDQTNINMTVSAGPGFLNGESGSTVKHLNWPIPTCIAAGNYNLTFYESSQFNKIPVFAITPILIPITNPNPSGNCSNLNPLQPQPQPASPLSQSPFAPGSSISASGSPLSATPSSSGMVTVITSSPSAGLETLTLTLSGGVIEIPTITVTAQQTPTTVVLISMATVTETDQGTVTTYTQKTTITTVITSSSGTPSPTLESSSDNTSGFIPVNAASHLFVSFPLYHLLFGTLFVLM